MPAGCLYCARRTSSRPTPTPLQALANAIVRADKWIAQTASPAEVAKVVPEAYLLGQPRSTRPPLAKSKEGISPDGSFPEDGAATALKALMSYVPDIEPGQDRPVQDLDQRVSSSGANAVSTPMADCRAVAGRHHLHLRVAAIARASATRPCRTPPWRSRPASSFRGRAHGLRQVHAAERGGRPAGSPPAAGCASSASRCRASTPAPAICSRPRR